MNSWVWHRKLWIPVSVFKASENSFEIDLLYPNLMFSSKWLSFVSTKDEHNKNKESLFYRIFRRLFYSHSIVAGGLELIS